MTQPFADNSDLERQVKQGTLWSLLSTFLLRIGQFAVGIVVARIVTPEQFGLMAVALTVHAIIISANDMGVTAAIMRDPGDVNSKLPTVNVIAIVFAATATLAMYLTAGGVATLLGAPAAKSAVQILSLTILIGGISAVPTALIFREFRQRERFISDSFNLLSSSFAVLILVGNGWGADGIAWSRVVGQVVGTVIYMGFAHYVIRLGFKREHAAELLRFGVPLAGSNIISFTVENVDYMVVGRLLGPVPLGYYTLAYNVAGWPPALTNNVLNTIVIPAAARLAPIRQDLRRELTRGFGLIGLVALPASALLMALAGPLVEIVYGTKWLPAVNALVVLALLGPVRIGTTALSDVLIALGRTGRLFAIRMGWLLLVLPALVIFVRMYDIVGAAVAQILVAVLFVLPAMLLTLRKEQAVSVAGMRRTLAPPTAASAVCGVTAFFTAQAISNQALALVAGGLAGAVVYVACLGPSYWRFRRRASGWWTHLRSSAAQSD